MLPSIYLLALNILMGGYPISNPNDKEVLCNVHASQCSKDLNSTNTKEYIGLLSDDFRQFRLCRISPTHIDTIANLHLMFPGVVSIHVGAGAAFTPVASFHTSELLSLVEIIHRVQSEVLN